LETLRLKTLSDGYLVEKKLFPHHPSETSTEYQTTSTIRHSHSFVVKWTDKMTTRRR